MPDEPMPADRRPRRGRILVAALLMLLAEIGDIAIYSGPDTPIYGIGVFRGTFLLACAVFLLLSPEPWARWALLIASAVWGVGYAVNAVRFSNAAFAIIAALMLAGTALVATVKVKASADRPTPP